MADIGTAVRQFLVAQASVSALIGTRMYPILLPQDATLPAVTYRQLIGDHEQLITGSKAGIASASIEISVFADTYEEAYTVSEAIRLSGILDIQGVTNSVDIRSVTIMTNLEVDIEHATDGSDDERFVFSRDYDFYYLETV